jgi:predicted thioredoxin/glutaredoxin
LPVEQRQTFISVPTVNKDTPLLPAGLLGPVTIRSVITDAVEP